MRRAPRIYVSAGEPSGDAHAAAVVTALRQRLPAAAFEAFGGASLEAAGATVLDRMERMSVVGFVEALWQLPAHLRLLTRVLLPRVGAPGSVRGPGVDSAAEAARMSPTPLVLMYHGFGTRSPDADPQNLFVPVEDFERHLRVLRRLLCASTMAR